MTETSQRTTSNQQDNTNSSGQNKKTSRIGSARTKKILVVVLVLLVVIGVVIVGSVVASQQKDAQTSGPIPSQPVSAQYPVSVDSHTAVVAAGSPEAPITIDMYEDFLCPACQSFYQTYDGQMRQAMADGQLRVRYHLVNFLDDKSNPSGYSGRAANAAVAAGTQGKFVEYYNSLYSSPPPEGSAGYTNDQLAELGRELGLDQQFVDDVKNEVYLPAVHRGYQRAQQTVGQNLYGGSFQTPTVVHNGQLVSFQDNGSALNWLDPLLAAGDQ